MTTVTLAWTAGFFDGEGCVMINRRVRGKFVEHYISAVIGQKRIRPLQYVQKHFGGILTKLTTSGCYQWRAHGFPAEHFYKAIRPYLILKGIEVDCALEIRKTVQEPGSRLKRGVWNKRDEIWKRFRAIREGKQCITS